MPSQDGERSSRGDKSMEVVWVGHHDASPQASSGRLSGSGRIWLNVQTISHRACGATSWLTHGKASIRDHRSRRVPINRNAGAAAQSRVQRGQGRRWRFRIWQL